jgi:hypothetical protein
MKTLRWIVGIALVAFTATTAAEAQGPPEPARVELGRTSMTLEVGDTVQLTAQVFDSAGNLIEVPVRFFARPRRQLPMTRDGKVMPVRGGEFEVIAFARGTRSSARATITVSVAFPAIDHITIDARHDRFYVGANVRHRATVIDEAGMERPEVEVQWSTSDPEVATVDRAGVMTAHKTGTVRLRATGEGVTGEHAYAVIENPIRTLTLDVSMDQVRTGDVVHVTAAALDARGTRLDDAPILYTLLQYPEDAVVAHVPGAEIDDRGRFVAYKGGAYTVMAVAPGHVATRTIEVTARHVSQLTELVGQAAVRNVRTSDLWVWEGVDGRDYAVTGTWGAFGAAYFWDVTDPSNPVMTDSLVVDARTVNDVKVNDDGSVCVISREGASNRRNGLVILDCTNPRDIKIHATFDDGLTGGVHNLFVYEDHIYAVNNGRKFDVINIEDPAKPYRVGVFELDTPGHAIHDVWIVDGIAYTSNWGDGVVLIDVGNGVAGGSPSNPVKFAQDRDFGGATHAAFPYRSPTGKFYVFMGDEIGRSNGGTGAEGEPEAMAGYIHVVDFTDPMNPEEVARYEVPEAGSHNYWIEDDVLYAAFYNGGVRVVDISGELKGNLTYQGREVARFMAFDPEGYVANAPFTWGPQLFKGNLFFAEHYSGLWSIKLQPRQQTLTP